jgi:hypothetical protein
LNSGFLSVIVAGLTPLIVLTLLFLGIGYHTVAWQPPALWADEFGAGVVSAVAADSTGVYAGGAGGYAGYNLFLSRYDPGGQRVWNQDFGNSTIDQIKGISPGADGVYLVGVLNLTRFVRKYDPSGTLLWNIKYSGLFSGPSVSAGAGGVFVSYYDSLSSSALLRAYSSVGNSLWTSSLGNSTNVISMSTNSGTSSVYLLGNRGSDFLRSYNSDGTLSWAKNLTCSCQPIGVAADGSGIYVGGLAAQGFGTNSGVLVKYDSSGNVVWTRSFNAPDATTVTNPRMSSGSAGIYLAVTTSLSGFLIRYDSDGNQAWSFQTLVSANSVSVGQDGVYVGGEASNNAALSKYAQSSSLVLFGVNPPFSFGLVALLGGVVVLSLFWLRRQRKRGVRRPRSAVPYSPPKPSEDDSKWMRRPP